MTVKINQDNEVVITIDKPKCKKCGEQLYGGEIEFGICDVCENN